MITHHQTASRLTLTDGLTGEDAAVVRGGGGEDDDVSARASQFLFHSFFRSATFSWRSERASERASELASERGERAPNRPCRPAAAGGVEGTSIKGRRCLSKGRVKAGKSGFLVASTAFRVFRGTS